MRELDNMGPSPCRDDGDGSDTSSDGNWTTWDHLHVETMEMDLTRLLTGTEQHGDQLHVETIEMDRTRLHTGTGQHGTIYM